MGGFECVCGGVYQYAERGGTCKYSRKEVASETNKIWRDTSMAASMSSLWIPTATLINMCWGRSATGGDTSRGIREGGER